jgi:hypothetical protein
MVVVQSPRHPRMIAFRTILLAFALSFALVTSLAGPPPDLKATINELAPRSRRAAPEWIEVSLSSRSNAIREGALEFTMTEWGQTIYRYRTHDLVINSGDQSFRFLLPSSTATSSGSNPILELRLIEKSRTTEIGVFPLTTRQRDARAQVIAVIRPEFRQVGSETYPIWQALRLERLAPKEEGLNFDTTPVFLAPSDVPNDPLGFCAFNLVLIESDAFGSMREKARAALGQWVSAGGSLCVMANDGLDPQQVDAINSLAGGDPRWKPIRVDNAGRAQVPNDLALARVNFGRLAVAAKLPEEIPDQVPPTWRKISAFLWKMCADQAAIVEAEGKWNLQTKGQGQRNSFAIPGLPMNELMPRSVRVVPLWILASLIGLLLILVGPGDWFFLGKLKRRRLTWLLFPLVALLITAATVFAVQRYMGSTSHRRSLIISDIGVSGRVIRETRIDLDLPAREGTAVTPSANTLRVPVATESHFSHGITDEDWDGIQFRGQYPARYDYIRPLRQWTPIMMRSTTIADAADTSGIKWEGLDPKRIAGRWTGLLAPEISPGVPCGLDLFVRGAERTSGDGPLSSWRQSITTMPMNGLGALLTQESPNGFAGLNDLPVMQSRDPYCTLLVAARIEGENIHIWRRLHLH